MELFKLKNRSKMNTERGAHDIRSDIAGVNPSGVEANSRNPNLSNKMS